MTKKAFLGAVSLAVLAAGCGSKASGSGSGGSGSGGSGSGGTLGVNCLNNSDDLIANFTTDSGLNPADGRSGGFYTYGDPSEKAADMPAVLDPPEGTSSPLPDSTTGSSCSGPGSFHVKATGFKVWGAALGTDFVPKMGSYKGTYDASKYKGVSFWAKAATALTGVQVSFPDVWSDASAEPMAVDPNVYPCAYAAGALNNCSPYLVKLGSSDFPNYMDSQIGTDWKRFDIMFADTQQDKGNPGFHRDGMDSLDTNHLTGMAIQVDAIYDTSGKPSANDFEIWVDDIYFIR